MRARRLAGAAAVLLAWLSTGCLVEIDRVADPGAAFAEARREAARFQGRPGPAHHVNVLVYDHDDGQLVRVCVPMWLARRIARHEGGDVDAEYGEARAEEKVRRHVRLEQPHVSVRKLIRLAGPRRRTNQYVGQVGRHLGFEI